MTDTELIDKLQEYGRSSDNDFCDLNEMLDMGIDIRTAISVLGNPECDKPSAHEFVFQMERRQKEKDGWKNKNRGGIDAFRRIEAINTELREGAKEKQWNS